jgi:hypothetical protein
MAKISSPLSDIVAPGSDATQLRSLAQKSKDNPQAPWLKALAAMYDGATRTAAKIRGVGLQIIRDWTRSPSVFGAHRAICLGSRPLSTI